MNSPQQKACSVAPEADLNLVHEVTLTAKPHAGLQNIRFMSGTAHSTSATVAAGNLQRACQPWLTPKRQAQSLDFRLS
jgi:hypothetical protein